MKTFYFMGTNPNNKSQVSWKMWRIARKGRTVKVSWGPAKIENRKVTPVATLQGKTWTFSSEAAAKADEERRIREKLNGGYSKTVPQKTSK